MKSTAVKLTFFFSFAIFLGFCFPAEDFASDSVLIIPAKKAGSYIGRKVLVRGTVFEVYKSRKAVFINFGKDWRHDFTAVIFKENFKDFEAAGINPLDYKGRMAVVSGIIQKYRGRAEIILRSPAQIKAD